MTHTAQTQQHEDSTQTVEQQPAASQAETRELPSSVVELAGEPVAEPIVAPVVDQQTPQTGAAFAITSFVLGISSVVAGWTFIAPIVGLILGVLALRRKTAERTLALWGIWMNAAMLAITVLLLLAFALFVGFAFLTGLPTYIDMA